MELWQHTALFPFAALVRPHRLTMAEARLAPHFLPYEGLGMASDKVLGKLFLE